MYHEAACLLPFFQVFFLYPSTEFPAVVLCRLCCLSCVVRAGVAAFILAVTHYTLYFLEHWWKVNIHSYPKLQVFEETFDKKSHRNKILNGQLIQEKEYESMLIIMSRPQLSLHLISVRVESSPVMLIIWKQFLHLGSRPLYFLEHWWKVNIYSYMKLMVYIFEEYLDYSVNGIKY